LAASPKVCHTGWAQAGSEMLEVETCQSLRVAGDRFRLPQSTLRRSKWRYRSVSLLVLCKRTDDDGNTMKESIWRLLTHTALSVT